MCSTACASSTSVRYIGTQEAAPENFEDKPAPPWLADIASAVSALDTTGDGSLLTLETVRKRYPKSKAGDPYEAVWNVFSQMNAANTAIGWLRSTSNVEDQLRIHCRRRGSNPHDLAVTGF